MTYADGQQPGTRAFLLGVTLCLGLGIGVAGAEEESSVTDAVPAPGEPVVTVLAGVGHSVGGAGVEGQYYLGGGRFSLFAGFGYWFGDSNEDLCPSGAAGTGGARVFIGGPKHRGFLAISYGPVEGAFATDAEGELFDQAIVYGPVVQVGYQLVKSSGFTFQGSAGVGYARWRTYDVSVTSIQVGLAIGHTWR